MNNDPQALDLATIPDFELGPLRISPSSCRVFDGDTEGHVEARVMAVLVTLARAAPKTVTRDELAAACWGGRAITEDAISRAIAKLRALSRRRAPPAFVIETVTKVGFKLVAANAVAAPQPTAVATRLAAWRRFVLPAAGLLGLVAFAVIALWPAPQQQAYVSFAPFEQRAPELERLSGLTRDAVFRMATASGIAMFESRIDTERSADFSLSGALDREGGTPTVTLRLTDARSNVMLWSRTLTGDEDGEPALADMAAVRGIEVMHCALSERRRERRPIAPATLALYFNVCDSAVTDDFDGMIDSARELAGIAPNSATALALLANALAGAASTTRTPQEVAALRSEATAKANRALGLDRRQPRAYLALASAGGGSLRWTERERLLQRALDLDPNLRAAHVMYVKFLRDVGRWREALEVSARRNLGERASGLPQLALLQASQGDVLSAYETVDRFARIYPSKPAQLRWTILVWWDTPERARRLNRNWGEGLPEASLACFDGLFAQMLGPNATAQLPAECRNFDEHWQVRMLARLGNVDAALNLLTAPEQREVRSTTTLFYREMAAVRADARFVEIVRENGLLDYWRTTGHHPDFCALESPPLVCSLIDG